uniref:Uncharacterized protein n=1 Tax=mine drainage metagenome TaxID=410659 RepID=E6QEM2_9ZZZZ
MTPLNDPASVFSPERVPTAGGDRLGLGGCSIRAMDTVWTLVSENTKIDQTRILITYCFIWWGRRDSNPRPTA